MSERLNAKLKIDFAITGRREVTKATEELEKLRSVFKNVAQDLGAFGSARINIGAHIGQAKSQIDAVEREAQAKRMNSIKQQHVQEIANIKAKHAAQILEARGAKKAIDDANKLADKQRARAAKDAAQAEAQEQARRHAQDIANIKAKTAAQILEAKQAQDQAKSQLNAADREAHTKRMNNIKVEHAQEMANMKAKMAAQAAEARRAQKTINDTFKHGEKKRVQDEMAAARGHKYNNHMRRDNEKWNAQWEIRKQTLANRNFQSSRPGAPDMSAISSFRNQDIAKADVVHKKLQEALGKAVSLGGDDNWSKYFDTREEFRVQLLKLNENEKLRVSFAKDLNRESANSIKREQKLAATAVRNAREEERRHNKELRANKSLERERNKLEMQRVNAGRRALGWASQRGQGGIFGISPSLIAGGAAIDITRRGLGSAIDLSSEAISVSSLNAGVDYKGAQGLVRGSLRKYGGDIGLLGASLRDIAGSDFQGADVGKVFDASQMLAFGNPGLGGDKATNAIITALKAYNWKGDRAGSVADMFVAAGPAGRIEVKDIAEHYGKVAGTTSALGISLADTLGFTSAASLGGLSAEQSFTGLDQVLSSLLMANQSGTKSAAARKLGLGTKSEWIKEKGLGGILSGLQSYQGKDKNDLIQQVFADKDGRRALMSILSAGDLSRYTTAKSLVENGAGSNAAKAAEVGQSDYGRWEKAKGEFVAVLTELGEAMMPVAREIMPEVVAGLKSFSTWLNDPQSKETIKKFWEAGKAIAPWILGMAAFNMTVGATARSLSGIAGAAKAASDAWKWMDGIKLGVGNVPVPSVDIDLPGSTTKNAAANAIGAGAGSYAGGAAKSALSTAGRVAKFAGRAAGAAGIAVMGGAALYEILDKWEQRQNPRFKREGTFGSADAQLGPDGRPIMEMDHATGIMRYKKLKKLTNEEIEAQRRAPAKALTDTERLMYEGDGTAGKSGKGKFAQYKKIAVRDENGAVVMDPYTFAPQYKKVRVQGMDSAYAKPVVNDYSNMQMEYAKTQSSMLAQAMVEALAQASTHDQEKNHHMLSMTLDLTGDKPVVSKVKSYIDGWEVPTSVKATDGRVVTDR